MTDQHPKLWHLFTSIIKPCYTACFFAAPKTEQSCQEEIENLIQPSVF